MPEQRIELKLTPLDERVSIEDLPDPTDLTNGIWMKWLKDRTTPYFGSIRPIFESKAFRYKIVEFYPHAAEIDKRKKAFYPTEGEAIGACIKFLEEKGYSVKIFDLESRLSRV
jgi:hypothetical protein